MKNTTVRIPDEIHEALSLSAGRNYRSLHGEILEWLVHYAKLGANITTEEKDRLFYNQPNYKNLANNRKQRIKELEETVAALEQTIAEINNPGVDVTNEIKSASVTR